MDGPRHAIIGNPNGSFWLHHSETGFDLTHPPTPRSPPVLPRIPLETTTEKVAITPSKAALVIIDMQNFFLSEKLGWPADSKGMKAAKQLADFAIPACKRANIQIIWLNWGLSQEEVENMPPAILRSFGFPSVPTDQPLFGVDGKVVKTADRPHTHITTSSGTDPRIYCGLGSMMGAIQLEDGDSVSGGQPLMRDQWNTQLHPNLEKSRQEMKRARVGREDVWIHKNRMSGLWDKDTLCTQYLEEQGIKTLLFAGVNTDHCVAGSLQDAYAQGYDCLLLSDGSATTSPDFAQQSIEFNTANVWGFVLNCEALARGVDNMQTA